MKFLEYLSLASANIPVAKWGVLTKIINVTGSKTLPSASQVSLMTGITSINSSVDGRGSHDLHRGVLLSVATWALETAQKWHLATKMKEGLTGDICFWFLIFYWEKRPPDIQVLVSSTGLLMAFMIYTQHKTYKVITFIVNCRFPVFTLGLYLHNLSESVSQWVS